MNDGLTLTDLNEDAAEALEKFGHLLGQITWFADLGEELHPGEADIAQAYLDALGFPHADIALIPDWEDAAAAAENPDINSDWWEAEEQQRAHLASEALLIFSEADLSTLLQELGAIAAPGIKEWAQEHAAYADVEDEALLNAAVGAATQAVHQAALVIAAGEEESHPFALKFRLFEAGRWPIGVSGQSFNLF